VPEENQNVSRRQFTKYLTLGGVFAAAGAAWFILRSRFSRGHASPVRVIARAGEIAVRESKIFQYPTDSDPCILIRPAADKFVAYSRLCTHATCPVYYRPAQNTIECPCHQGYFSVADGSVIEGPPPRPLPRILVERRGDDIVATGVLKG
jgi:nitrite reductase/ring-hydroxylating ferredoxin subunit